MRGKLTCVTDVVAWRLCLGCGACVEVCPAGALSLVDIEDDGLRPLADPGKCSHCGDCIRVCPGVAIEAPAPARKAIAPLHRAWGNVLEIWEGYACDPEIRYLGSSGGLATALSLCGLEKGGMGGCFTLGPKRIRP